MTATGVRRYRGVLAGAVLLAAVGAVVTSDWLIALAAVPLAFVAVEELAAPSPSKVAVERTLSATRPEPGQRVTVELTVRNAGESPITDLRIHDGVPTGLSVVDGTPRDATALAPGDAETIEYAVRALRGDHAFASPAIRIRGVVGGTIREDRPDVTGERSLVAERFFEHAPTAEETATMVGVVPTDRGGSGVEFHTTREYRAGDPINRIDWRRLARTGDLSTVNYREHEGASVAVLADCRHATPADDGSAGTLPDAVRQSLLDRTGYAAHQTVHALSEAEHDAGLGAIGNGVVPWVPPGATDAPARARAAIRSVEGSADWDGPTLFVDSAADRPDADGSGTAGSVDATTGAAPTQHAQSAAAADTGDAADATRGSADATRGSATAEGTDSADEGADTDEADDPSERDEAAVAAPDGGTATVSWDDAGGLEDGAVPGSSGRTATDPVDPGRLADRIATSLPAGGTAVLVSPLLDDGPVELASRLEARGHPVTVLTPALGESDRPQVGIASVARRTRIERLRSDATPVIDWADAERLAAAVARAEVRRQ